MLELTDAGLDLRQIEKPDELKRLSAHHALQLAEAALGDGLAVRHRLALRALSRNCPLLAVVAAELLKSGELSAKNLADTDECRTLVFDGMLREARPIRDQFGAARTDDFLRLIALLAPVQADTDFFKTAAAFLGDSTQPNLVANLVEALDDVGLLLRNGKNISITPDLLSDHLAYTACYDRTGQNTTFAERVNEHFSSEKFPRLLQHLSEAEWRARQQHPPADSIVEPIWRGFMERFEASSFDSRRRQIEQWTNFAHLQPQRTLSLAQTALDLEEAPAETNVWVFKGWGDSHAYVVEALPALLKPVAEHHPDWVAPCLDLLWVLGKDQSAPRLSNVGNHPIAIIGRIATYQKWKSRKIQEAALTWIENRLQRPDWTAAPAGPHWILRELLHPFFGLEVEENWLSGNKVYWHSLPIDLDATDELRRRALCLCKNLLAQSTVPVALAALDVLQHAIRRANIPMYRVTPDFVTRWLAEQRAALKIIAVAVRDRPEPIIQRCIHSMLLRVLRYDPTDFRKDCKKLFATIHDTLDLRVLRAVLGNYADDFERPPTRRPISWQEKAKRRWKQFIHQTAVELLAEYPDPAALLDYATRQHTESRTMGYHPNFRELFTEIARFDPTRALQVASSLLTRRSNPLGWTFGLLISAGTRGQPNERLRWCEEAMATGDADLAVGTISAFVVWRDEGGMPPRAWELIGNQAQDPSEEVDDAILRFVEYSHDPVVPDDWRLLAALSRKPHAPKMVNRLLACAATLLDRGSALPENIADELLALLDAMPSLADHDVQRALKKFGKFYPGKILLLLSRRLQLKQTGTSELELVPFDFQASYLTGALDDPAAAEFVRTLEQKLVGGTDLDAGETQILQLVIFRGGADTESELLRWLKLATTDRQLGQLAEFVHDALKPGEKKPVKVKKLDGLVTLVRRMSWPIAIEYPNFARALLEAARGIDAACHQEVFQTLASSSGGRSTEGGNPSEEWENYVNAISGLAKQYADDVALGKLYATIEKHERDWMDHMQGRDAEFAQD